jgi:hypothetical protein
VNLVADLQLELAALVENWLRGMTPSDFSPACTTTNSLLMSTTVPVTMEPGSISTVLRLSSNNSAKLSLIKWLCHAGAGVRSPLLCYGAARLVPGVQAGWLC